jgi:hypothetical protein
MAKFIELTSNKSKRPVLINIDNVAWISTREGSNSSLVTVIHFNMANSENTVSLTVSESYEKTMYLLD